MQDAAGGLHRGAANAPCSITPPPATPLKKREGSCQPPCPEESGRGEGRHGEVRGSPRPSAPEPRTAHHGAEGPSAAEPGCCAAEGAGEPAYTCSPLGKRESRLHGGEGQHRRKKLKFPGLDAPSTLKEMVCRLNTKGSKIEESNTFLRRMDVSRALLKLKSWPERRWGFRTGIPPALPLFQSIPEVATAQPRVLPALSHRPVFTARLWRGLGVPCSLLRARSTLREPGGRCAGLGRPLLPERRPGRAGLGWAGRWLRRVTGPGTRIPGRPVERSRWERTAVLGKHLAQGARSGCAGASKSAAPSFSKNNGSCFPFIWGQGPSERRVVGSLVIRLSRVCIFSGYGAKGEQGMWKRERARPPGCSEGRGVRRDVRCQESRFPDFPMKENYRAIKCI